ncbi:hypothetical protein ACJX0J_020543, partial [Zea mays]
TIMKQDVMLSVYKKQSWLIAWWLTCEPNFDYRSWRTVAEGMISPLKKVIGEQLLAQNFYTKISKVSDCEYVVIAVLEVSHFKLKEIFFSLMAWFCVPKIMQFLGNLLILIGEVLDELVPCNHIHVID